MTPSRVCFLSVIPLLSAVGCGALLGIPPTDSDDDGGRGGTSSAGNGGHATGGRAGEDGAGDSSGATTGGAGEAGSPSSGGNAGTGGTGGSTSGGSSGMGGDGEGGTSVGDFPQPGDACSASGALACLFNPANPEPTVDRLVCNQGTWMTTATCERIDGRTHFCDRRDGTCASMICNDPGDRLANRCFGSLVAVCGPDRVTTELEPCVFGCDDNNSCRVAGPGQLVIDRPRSVEARENPWPGRLIPVCWRELSEDEALTKARTAVRVAVESLWSRESVVGFTGWGSCDSSQAHVELDFADDCAGELARIPRDGYPGAATALPVTLCRSSHDFTPMGTDPSYLELLGFVAQHVFAHVLGFEDELHDELHGDGLAFMDPVLELANLRELRPGYEMLELLANWYGSAPGRSLLSPDGRCLSYDSGVLSASACDGSSAQVWEPRDNALAHGSGKCVSGPANGDALEIAECSAEPLEEKEWLPAHVRIHDWLDYCLVAGSRSGDKALASGNCDPYWPVEQRFRVEFVGPRRVRIHTTSDCIVAPVDWTQLSVPELGPCDGFRAVFDAVEGTLGQDGRCLTVGRLHDVVFEPCGTASNQQFRLSGPFEHDGNALEFPIGEQAVTLTSTALGPIPAANQIFDYRF